MLKISNATECTEQEEDVEGHICAETTERTVMDGADNGTQGFPLYTYYCITLQVLPAEFLSLTKIILRFNTLISN